MAKTYTVKSGDTLWDIAKSNNTTVADIQAANPSIKNPDRIYSGAVITIPGAKQAAAQQTSSANTNTSSTANNNTNAAPKEINPATDYKQYTYDDSTNEAYQQALAALQQAQKSLPTYNGTYDAQLDEVYNQIVNREKFSYDLNSDALYQQYAEQYKTQGKLAMMDTMGQAAAMTGGYGNSYASAAGNQAYQAYLQQLNDVVPELYGMALDQYNQEGQDLLNQYAMLGDMADTEYGRYQDSLNQYWQNVSYHTDQANNAYDRGYSNWYNGYQNAYQAERDRVSDERWQTEYDEALRQYNEQMAYQKERDKIADDRYEREYADSKAASSSGGSSSGTRGTLSTALSGRGYDNGNLTTAQVKELQNALGVSADGLFGGDSKKAALALGFSSADVAYDALVKNRAPAGGDDDLEADLNTLIRKGASKSQIGSLLRAELQEGNITQAEYNKLKEQYMPRGNTY